MTTLMMPSEYGVEMFLGSSPVLTSGYLSSQPFLHDYPRLGPHQTPPPPPLHHNTPTSLHSFWGGGGFGGGGACSSTNTNSRSTNLTTSSTFRGPIENFDPLLTYTGNNNNNNNIFDSRNTSVRSINRRVLSKKKFDSLNLQPIKSCLVARQEESELEFGAISPTRLKKKVVFADTQGHPLTEIRLLTERPDCPPRWTPDFLEQVTGGAKAEAVTDQWELAFAQPASDYLGMKARLERDNVCLENALVKTEENNITGTIKVRNLSFEKYVKVRYTVNHWASYEDVEASYVPSMTASASYDIYDTFSFAIPLPTATYADKLEFCVCYNSGNTTIGNYASGNDGNDNWDNNNGKNYVIVSFRQRGKNTIENISKPKDVYDLEIDAWSEFASWNHLSISEEPYW